MSCKGFPAVFVQTSRYLRPPLVLDEDLPASAFPAPKRHTRHPRGADTYVTLRLPLRDAGKRVLYFAARRDRPRWAKRRPHEREAYGATYPNQGVARVGEDGLVTLKIRQPTAYLMWMGSRGQGSRGQGSRGERKTGRYVTLPPHVHFTLEDGRGGWKRRLKTALVYRHVCHAPFSRSFSRSFPRSSSGSSHHPRRYNSRYTQDGPVLVRSKTAYDAAVRAGRMNVYLT